MELIRRVDIETYGLAKKDWFNQFLELANGIPSHDTFARVFARLNPEQFQQSFLSWVKSISNVTQGEVIAIDGKTLRRSYDRSQSQGAISMVSAWATNNRLVLGQVKVDKKSNEIKAIPELIKVLSLRGCIVTIGGRLEKLATPSSTCLLGVTDDLFGLRV